MSRANVRKPQTGQIRLSIEVLESRDCPAAYSIVDLLPPPGGLARSEAYGLNVSGIVVGSGLQTSGYGQAAVWPVGTGATRSGVFLPMLAGDNYSAAFDVNNAGLIAGVSSVVAEFSHAVVWIGSGNSYRVCDLVSLGGSLPNDQVIGLSEADSQGVTWAAGSSYDTTGIQHPTLWRLDGAGNTLSTIDLEPVGPTRAWTQDVRVVGSTVYVVGGYSLDQVSSRARIWQLDLSGNVVSRTDLGTLGGPNSSGTSINNDGHVVGSSTLTSGGSEYAFLYRNDTMINLGSLGNRGSWAAAVNDSDTIVGTYQTSVRGSSLPRSDAFVWTNETMLDLRGQLASPDRSNWGRLFHAGDINAVGQIVGLGSIKVGKSRYEQHGYLVTPPALQASALGVSSDANSLLAAQAQPILAEALSRWQAAGADIQPLGNIRICIADLGGTTLGLAAGNTVWLDDNAAGWAWFVDPTPWHDSEFTTSRDQGEQHRMDLLTVLSHEIGHLLGYEHEDDGVMQETLAADERLTLHEGDMDWRVAVDLFFSATPSKKRK